MFRSKLEVADIFRRHGEAWRMANVGHVSLTQRRVMTAIESCRTAALGGHIERCEDCEHTRIAYNSCLMGKFRNGELATARQPFDGVSRVSTLIGLPFTLHYNGACRDSCVARWRFGQHRVFRTSVCRFDAQDHGNPHGRGPEAIEALVPQHPRKGPF
jgi:hypothetical protein